MAPFFLAEMLIHSLVKRTRLVFFDSFENKKITLFPSLYKELVATEKITFCVLSTPPRADFANQFLCWRAQVF